MEHPYTDIFQPADVLRELAVFIQKWKSSNFLRRDSRSLTDVLTPYQLSVATSGKLNQTYTLFRGFRQFAPTDFYTDQFPSSWSTDMTVAERFGGTCLVALEVPCTSVFLDLEYLNRDSEHEVILLPGTYAPMTVSSNGRPSSSGLRSRLQAVSDSDLKLMCDDRGITNISNSRAAMIDALVQHQNGAGSWTDKAAIHEARKLGL